MPKAVLTTKVDPSYDDLPEERYHFLRTYLNAARIVRVDADPRRADHYYAYVDDYLEFDRPVPFREAGLFCFTKADSRRKTVQ